MRSRSRGLLALLALALCPTSALAASNEQVYHVAPPSVKNAAPEKTKAPHSKTKPESSSTPKAGEEGGEPAGENETGERHRTEAPAPSESGNHPGSKGGDRDTSPKQPAGESGAA